MVFYKQRVQKLIYNRQMSRAKIKIKIKTSQIQLKLLQLRNENNAHSKHHSWLIKTDWSDQSTSVY